MRRYVITHPEYGIYLGNGLGMGFWTLMDTLGLPAAVTFHCEPEARQHIATWDSKIEGCSLVPVEMSADDPLYAFIPQLKAAGLEKLMGDMEKRYTEERMLRECEPQGRA